MSQPLGQNLEALDILKRTGPAEFIYWCTNHVEMYVDQSIEAIHEHLNNGQAAKFGSSSVSQVAQ